MVFIRINLHTSDRLKTIVGIFQLIVDKALNVTINNITIFKIFILSSFLSQFASVNGFSLWSAFDTFSGTENFFGHDPFKKYHNIADKSVIKMSFYDRTDKVIIPYSLQVELNMPGGIDSALDAIG